jgi:hypothetical protein
MQATFSRERRPLEASRRSVCPNGAQKKPSWGMFTVFNRVRAVCVPSSDPVFGRVVHGVLMSKAITSTHELEDALRQLYPMVRVRPRELSGELGVTWYVYREGDFPSRSSESGSRSP